MAACSATSPIKTFLFIIIILFWLAGGFLLYVGIHYVRVDYGSLGKVDAWPAAILVTASGVLIFGGLIGCVGAAFEKKTCLGLFLVFLFSVLIVFGSICGIMLVKKQNSKTAYNEFVGQQFSQYGSITSNSTSNDVFNSTYFIEQTQIKYKCCGFHNYTDWKNVSWVFNSTGVPVSCCKPHNSSLACNGSTGPSQLDFIYTKGCSTLLDQMFESVYNFLNYTAVALSALVLCGIIGVLIVLYAKRNTPLGYSELSPAYTDI